MAFRFFSKFFYIKNIFASGAILEQNIEELILIIKMKV
jgi:hypothetical protein